jgi:hypothetical protein
MLKLTVGVLAVALAGTSAAGWRSIRIDASSEASFNESVAALKEELPLVRQRVLERSLEDIWTQGTKAAAAEAREYTFSDYLRQLDGLGYKQIVTFTDPSGDTADRYFGQAWLQVAGSAQPWPPRFPRPSPGVLSNPYPPDGGRNAPPGVNPWQR